MAQATATAGLRYAQGLNPDPVEQACCGAIDIRLQRRLDAMGDELDVACYPQAPRRRHLDRWEEALGNLSAAYSVPAAVLLGIFFVVNL